MYEVLFRKNNVPVVSTPEYKTRNPFFGEIIISLSDNFKRKVCSDLSTASILRSAAIKEKFTQHGKESIPT